jgi:hypothetical protein
MSILLRLWLETTPGIAASRTAARLIDRMPRSDPSDNPTVLVPEAICEAVTR